MKDVYGKIERVHITSEALQKRIKELAIKISEDYKDKKSEPILIGNLKGCFVFLADLVRYMTIPVKMDFVAMTSYKGAESSGVVRIIKDLKMNIVNRDVIIIEDIIDTGLTIEYILKYLEIHKTSSIRVCCLLDKEARRKVKVPIDYCGFKIPDEFVVGFGLDYKENYRELDRIVIINLDKGN